MERERDEGIERINYLHLKMALLILFGFIRRQVDVIGHSVILPT